MAKIELDKYYTPIEVANRCWDKIKEVIGFENITQIIEPSVGNGAFCHYSIKPNMMIDIKPEIEGAIQADFLTYNIEYKKGTLVIGNPPYGKRNNLSRSFFNKSCEIADYIGFILPITQFNNTDSLYKFDLIYSEDLGTKDYSEQKLHCCFNIYKRPKTLNKKPCVKIQGINIYRYDIKEYDCIKDYDLRMCYWGNGSVGKILNENEHYSAEYKIKIDNDNPQKDDIIRIIKETDWKKELVGISMKRITQNMIYNLLKKNGIEELKDKCRLF